jgi:hypothetical protein
MPVLDVSRCKARIINHETAARMVETYHYAHRVPSIVVAVGMYVDGVLAGCVTYGIPPVPNVQRCCGEEYRKNCLELNRLYIHDWAGHNSESWIIGQSFSVLSDQHPEYFVLVSYADTGEGHEGIIYRATNWMYTGLHAQERCAGVLLNGGTTIHSKHLVNMFGTRSIDTIQANLGTRFVSIIEGLGKHRYVYFLGSKRQRKALRKALKWDVLPYPKATPEKD